MAEKENLEPDFLRNGGIATVDGSRPFTQAVAIQDGLFLAVGSNEEIMRLRGSTTEVIDLGGRTVATQRWRRSICTTACLHDIG